MNQKCLTMLLLLIMLGTARSLVHAKVVFGAEGGVGTLSYKLDRGKRGFGSGKESDSGPGFLAGLRFGGQTNQGLFFGTALHGGLQFSTTKSGFSRTLVPLVGGLAAGYFPKKAGNIRVILVVGKYGDLSDLDEIGFGISFGMGINLGNWGGLGFRFSSGKYDTFRKEPIFGDIVGSARSSKMVGLTLQIP